MRPITLCPDRFIVTALMASRPFMESALNVLGALELELKLTDRDTLCLSWEVCSLTLAGVNNLLIFVKSNSLMIKALCRNCDELRRILTQGDLWLALRLSGGES